MKLNWIKLTTNTSKTKPTVFTCKYLNQLPNIFFHNTCLEWVDSIKYLGITIDKKLNFIQQSKEVVQKLSKMQGVFYSMKNYMSKTTLLTLYHSLVYPVIIQNIIIWGGVSESNRKPINVSINKILRLILNVRYVNYIPTIPTNNMYVTLKLLKFDDIYKYFLLRFFHFVSYIRTDIFDSNFSHLLPSHNYATRNRLINLPDVRLDIEKQFVIYQCCKLLNDLDLEFVNPQSDYLLKKKF